MTYFISRELKKTANKKKAKILQSFFKTRPGEYGEGDIFLGITVPQVRIFAKKYSALAFPEIEKLLRSGFHEERLLALMILVLQYQRADQKTKKLIYNFYLKHTKYINNWDLVDLSSYHIVGDFLFKKGGAPIQRLAVSESLWERRIAVIATFYFIRNQRFEDTFRIVRRLLNDPEDLIQKACGWMLREIGKRDYAALDGFLRCYYRRMPRTMLRYAIEKYPKARRQDYLKGRI